jgi:hypothetical protein
MTTAAGADFTIGITSVFPAPCAPLTNASRLTATAIERADVEPMIDAPPQGKCHPPFAAFPTSV